MSSVQYPRWVIIEDKKRTNMNKITISPQQIYEWETECSTKASTPLCLNDLQKTKTGIFLNRHKMLTHRAQNARYERRPLFSHLR